MDSADDNGIVRKNSMPIVPSSPHPLDIRKRIDLDRLHKKFDDLQSIITGIFSNYVDEKIDLSGLGTH